MLRRVGTALYGPQRPLGPSRPLVGVAGDALVESHAGLGHGTLWVSLRLIIQQLHLCNLPAVLGVLAHDAPIEVGGLSLVWYPIVARVTHVPLLGLTILAVAHVGFALATVKLVVARVFHLSIGHLVSNARLVLLRWTPYASYQFSILIESTCNLLLILLELTG